MPERTARAVNLDSSRRADAQEARLDRVNDQIHWLRRVEERRPWWRALPDGMVGDCKTAPQEPLPSMPYALKDLPLEFRPKKRGTTVVLSVVIVLELVFAFGFEMSTKWPVQAFFTKGLISTLSFLFIVGACVVGIVQAHRRKDRMVIDQTGVLLDLNGVSRAWRWQDMARFHLVMVHAPSKTRMVAIEPKGEAAFDAKANVIWPKFGPSTEEFLTLLRAGKARWGET